MPRVALIERESDVRGVLESKLQERGFDVRSAQDAPDGLRLVRDWMPDCVLIDIALPSIDGLELIPIVRKMTEVPIVMLTDDENLHGRTESLVAGADDYLAAPFNVDNLATIVRGSLENSGAKVSERMQFADLDIDRQSRTVRRGERSVGLSTREFELLETLARRPNRVFSRSELLDLVWGSERGITPATVETYISYLRRKIEVPPERRLIHTVRGVGYVLREP